MQWTPARNTLESAGWPPFFHLARLRDTWFLTAADGRALLFDAGRQTAGFVDKWNASDVVAMRPPCAPQHLLAPRSDSTLQLFEFMNQQFTEASEPEPLGGQLTALWSFPDGALAVVRDARTSRYAAYHVSVACRS